MMNDVRLNQFFKTEEKMEIKNPNNGVALKKNSLFIKIVRCIIGILMIGSLLVGFYLMGSHYNNLGVALTGFGGLICCIVLTIAFSSRHIRPLIIIGFNWTIVSFFLFSIIALGYINKIPFIGFILPLVMLIASIVTMLVFIIKEPSFKH